MPRRRRLRSQLHQITRVVQVYSQEEELVVCSVCGREVESTRREHAGDQLLSPYYATQTEEGADGTLVGRSPDGVTGAVP